MGSSSSKRREKSAKTINNSESSAPAPPPLRPEQPTVAAAQNGHVVTNRDVQAAISRGNNFCVSCFRDISVDGNRKVQYWYFWKFFEIATYAVEPEEIDGAQILWFCAGKMFTLPIHFRGTARVILDTQNHCFQLS